MIKLFRDTDIGGSLSGGYDSQPTDSGGPDPIPEDVRKKIDKFAKYYVLRRLNLEEDIRYCVEHGYSLSLPTIQAQEERIRVLEERIRELEEGKLPYLIPDLSNASKEAKDKFVGEMIQTSAVPLLVAFITLGLTEHITGHVVNGEKHFELKFTKLALTPKTNKP